MATGEDMIANDMVDISVKPNATVERPPHNGPDVVKVITDGGLTLGESPSHERRGDASLPLSEGQEVAAVAEPLDQSESKALSEAKAKRATKRRRSRRGILRTNDAFSDSCPDGELERYHSINATQRHVTRSGRCTRSSSRRPPLSPPTTKDEPLVIDSEDDGEEIACTSQSTDVVMAMEENPANEKVKMDVSFVSTPMGDGIIVPRARHERRETMPSIKKVQLAWGFGFFNEASLKPVPDESRLIYPDRETPGAVEVTRKDVIRLQEDIYVNDTLIDFYLRYLLTRQHVLGRGLKRNQVHVFSPLFFQAISSERSKSDADLFAQVVKKWTKNIDIFDKKMVFFPVNSCLHWSLVVLCNPDRLKPSSNRRHVSSSCQSSAREEGHQRTNAISAAGFVERVGEADVRLWIESPSRRSLSTPQQETQSIQIEDASKQDSAGQGSPSKKDSQRIGETDSPAHASSSTPLRSSIRESERPQVVVFSRRSSEHMQSAGAIDGTGHPADGVTSGELVGGGKRSSRTLEHTDADKHVEIHSPSDAHDLCSAIDAVGSTDERPEITKGKNAPVEGSRLNGGGHQRSDHLGSLAHSSLSLPMSSSESEHQRCASSRSDKVASLSAQSVPVCGLQSLPSSMNGPTKRPLKSSIPYDVRQRRKLAANRELGEECEHGDVYASDSAESGAPVVPMLAKKSKDGAETTMAHTAGEADDVVDVRTPQDCHNVYRRKRQRPVDGITKGGFLEQQMSSAQDVQCRDDVAADEMNDATAKARESAERLGGERAGVAASKGGIRTRIRRRTHCVGGRVGQEDETKAEVMNEDCDEEVPCMLMFDSTKGHASHDLFRTVRRYVAEAWVNTQRDTRGEVDISAKTLPGRSPPVPQQTNDCDCGVYLIHYAKLLMGNRPRVTKRFIGKNGRGSIFSTKWFREEDISKTRDTIRCTIEKLRWEAVCKSRANVLTAKPG